MAGWLWAGPEAAVSHRSAAALWKLDGIDAGNVIELTTTGSRNHVPNGLTLHRTRLLTPSDTGWLGALKVTGLVRTLVDLGAVVQDTALVEAAMESALRRDQQLFDRMKERLETLGGHGRRGAGVLREILALRDPDAAPTEGMFETLMERRLRAWGLEMPVRQYEVSVGGRVVRIDFAWVRKRVGLEPRGFWCHSGREKFLQRHRPRQRSGAHRLDDHLCDLARPGPQAREDPVPAWGRPCLACSGAGTRTRNLLINSQPRCQLRHPGRYTKENSIGSCRFRRRYQGILRSIPHLSRSIASRR